MCVLWPIPLTTVYSAHLFNKVNDKAVNTGMTTLNDIHTIPSNSLNIQPIG